MSGLIYILLLLAGLILIAWQASNLVAMYFGVPFIRTHHKAIKDVLELANIKEGDKFFELGSMWGGTLAYVSKRYKAKAYGIEVSPIHYLVSQFINYNNNLVKIRLADFNDFTLHRADIIYCKLSKNKIKELEKKFLKELSPGARVITYKYPLPNTEHKFTYKSDKELVYYYEF